MKKIIVFSFLFASVTVFAQNIPAEDTTEHFVKTETGKPIGKIVEKMMNKDGGSLVSEDGTVELIIPTGALTKKTTISIQTMTNTFQNGNGLSYRLEPSGIQFQQPVQIIFHYNPEKSVDSAQLLMGIAMQDDSGQWYGLDEFTLDTIAKTISGNIDHFSIWATFDQLKLKTLTGEYRLKVKKSLVVGIWGVFADKKEMKSRGLSKLKTMKPPEYMIWSVEEVRFGNDQVGTLKSGLALNDDRFNYYTAPNNIPDVNPVTISVDLTWNLKRSDGVYYRHSYLSTKILIYDNAYEVKMTSYIDLSSGDGSVTYQDTGSFVVSLNGKETAIIEKLNKNTNDEFNYEFPDCKTKTIKPGSGFIHMVGDPVITVTPATPTQPTRVKIEFIRTKLILPSLEFTCKDRKGKIHTFTTEQLGANMSGMNAYPQSIEFTAREGEEEWEIYETEFPIREGVHIQGKTLLKYIIRRLKDDE